MCRVVLAVAASIDRCSDFVQRWHARFNCQHHWRPDIPTPLTGSRRSLLQVLATAPLIGPAAAQAQTPGGAAPGSSVTPEQFGATGDGRTDDSAALQRAFDAVAARGRPGVVILQPRVAYRCDQGLVLDASHVSLWGQGLLDFARCTGTCLRVNASSVAAPLTPSNNYGHRGMISGALMLRGGGNGKTAIGILFDADPIATSAQLLIENMTVSDCTVGIEFRRRAYNNVLIRCDIHNCGRCLFWREAEDNGERNTLIGCALYNSQVAVRMQQPSGAFYLESCSIDYTATVYEVARGMVFATDCHHEGRDWTGRPFRCHGDGGVIHLTGGILLGQADALPGDAVFEVGEGASVRLDGVFAHNLAVASNPERPAPFATGPGHFSATRTEGFESGRLPARLHDARTMLADPDFTAPGWQDPVWRLEDSGQPITSRHGAEADGLRLLRAGGGGLRVVKRTAAGAPASFVLLSLAVRPGEQVLAGCQMRGAGGTGAVDLLPCWARIDGQDAAGVPVVTRRESVGVAVATARADRFEAAAAMGGRGKRLAPSWATHFLVVVDLAKQAGGELTFRGLWCDTI